MVTQMPWLWIVWRPTHAIVRLLVIRKCSRVSSWLNPTCIMVDMGRFPRQFLCLSLVQVQRDGKGWAWVLRSGWKLVMHFYFFSPIYVLLDPEQTLLSFCESPSPHWARSVLLSQCWQALLPELWKLLLQTSVNIHYPPLLWHIHAYSGSFMLVLLSLSQSSKDSVKQSTLEGTQTWLKILNQTQKLWLFVNYKVNTRVKTLVLLYSDAKPQH